MATSSSSTSSNKPPHQLRIKLRSSGFTLIELLVVIAITVILIAIIIGYSREGTRLLALTNTEAKILSLINRAKFLSIETYFGQVKSGNQRICSYGVKVDPASQEIFIFQDLSSLAECPGNSNNVYDQGEKLSGELNSVSLESALVAFAENTNLSEVVFIPPDPKTKINNSNALEGRIGVKIRDGNGQFTIVVNNAGQVRTE